MAKTDPSALCCTVGFCTVLLAVIHNSFYSCPSPHFDPWRPDLVVHYSTVLSAWINKPVKILVNLHFTFRAFLYKLMSVGGGNGWLTPISAARCEHQKLQPLKSAIWQLKQCKMFSYIKLWHSRCHLLWWQIGDVFYVLPIMCYPSAN